MGTIILLASTPGKASARHPPTQLPFIVWFIVSSLLHTLKRESGGGDVLRAAGRVLKAVVSLAVEEGVACAFGRVLCPLKTALTANMAGAAAAAGQAQGRTAQRV